MVRRRLTWLVLRIVFGLLRLLVLMIVILVFRRIVLARCRFCRCVGFWRRRRLSRKCCRAILSLLVRFWIGCRRLLLPLMGGRKIVLLFFCRVRFLACRVRLVILRLCRLRGVFRWIRVVWRSFTLLKGGVSPIVPCLIRLWWARWFGILRLLICVRLRVDVLTRRCIRLLTRIVLVCRLMTRNVNVILLALRNRLSRVRVRGLLLDWKMSRLYPWAFSRRPCSTRMSIVRLRVWLVRLV